MVDRVNLVVLDVMLLGDDFAASAEGVSDGGRQAAAAGTV
jgi:hypothetical protein